MGVMPEAFSDKVITYSILDWKSFKLTRVARSSLSAETQAAAGAMDMLEFVKVFWNLVEDPGDTCYGGQASRTAKFGLGC